MCVYMCVCICVCTYGNIYEAIAIPTLQLLHAILSNIHLSTIAIITFETKNHDIISVLFSLGGKVPNGTFLWLFHPSFVKNPPFKDKLLLNLS